MSNNDLSKNAANEQLMSCPFCGGEARVSEHVVPVTRFLDFGRRRITSEFKYGITCRECGAMGSQYYETMGEAVAAWNTRDPVPQEMSAREYVNARRQLCNAHLNAVTQCVDDFVTRCAGCLIEDYCEGAKDDIDEEIAIIEKWAREHPEERSEE